MAHVGRLRSTARIVLPAFSRKSRACKKLSAKLRFARICCENNVVCDNRKTKIALHFQASLSECYFHFLLSLRIAVILEKIKTRVLFSAQSENKRLILILYKNIDIPSKPPFEKGRLSRRVPLLRVQRLSGFPGYAVQLTQ